MELRARCLHGGKLGKSILGVVHSLLRASVFLQCEGYAGSADVAIADEPRGVVTTQKYPGSRSGNQGSFSRTRALLFPTPPLTAADPHHPQQQPLPLMELLALYSVPATAPSAPHSNHVAIGVEYSCIELLMCHIEPGRACIVRARQRALLQLVGARALRVQPAVTLLDQLLGGLADCEDTRIISGLTAKCPGKGEGLETGCVVWLSAVIIERSLEAAHVQHACTGW